MGSLLFSVGAIIFSSCMYGLGKLHGYEKWDKEHESFQEALWASKGVVRK